MTATIEDARHHVHHLRDAGMRMMDIAAAAGVKPNTMSRLMSGRGSCHPRTITAIMAVTPGANILPESTSVTDRILEEWEFMRGTLGMTSEYVAQRLSDAFGLSVPYIREVVGGADGHHR